MNRKKQIICMIQKINDIWVLNLIYRLIEDIVKEEVEHERK